MHNIGQIDACALDDGQATLKPHYVHLYGMSSARANSTCVWSTVCHIIV